MNCARCQRPLRSEAQWCSFCGEPVRAAAQEMLVTQPIAPVLAPEPIVQSVRTAPVSGSAIAALVFAIAGLVGPLWLIGPLLALAFARKARREMERSGWTLGGWEIARAARIIAWTALVFLIAGAIVFAGLIALSNYYDSTGNDFFNSLR